MRVTSVQDGAFIAAIGVSQAGVIETVDARPSDAIALALRAGSPIQVVQGVLGHSTIAITADTYSHLTADATREATERVGELLWAGSSV